MPAGWPSPRRALPACIGHVGSRGHWMPPPRAVAPAAAPAAACGSRGSSCILILRRCAADMFLNEDPFELDGGGQLGSEGSIGLGDDMGQDGFSAYRASRCCPSCRPAACGGRDHRRLGGGQTFGTCPS